MARGRLSQPAVDKLTAAGMYPDGDGLYLQVSGPESRSWIYRFTLRGKARWYGLGSAREVTLAKARLARDDARAQIRKGIDPVQERKDRDVRARSNERLAVPFRERAEQYIEAHEAGWRNQKHREQWKSSLETYTYPIIGDVPASSITASHVVDILRPIWSEKPETARRVRGRVEAVLDYAADPDDATYRNPASMTPQLLKKLPRLPHAKRQVNHPSLPYDEVGAFMVDLRQRVGIAARALEFVILTAARTSEALGATWDEFDLAGGVWTVPAGRMKSARPHKVPLSPAALSVLKGLGLVAPGNFAFPSLPRDRPLSNMALLVVLRRMNRADITVHGFRSTFRTWAAERTSFPREVAEAALAHVLENKTEAAYQRGDLFEKRRRLMDSWAEFCAKPSKTGTVLPLRTA